jgi:hypothetical protein
LPHVFSGCPNPESKKTKASYGSCSLSEIGKTSRPSHQRARLFREARRDSTRARAIRFRSKLTLALVATVPIQADTCRCCDKEHLAVTWKLKRECARLGVTDIDRVGASTLAKPSGLSETPIKERTTTWLVFSLRNWKNIAVVASTGKVVSRSSAEDGATARTPGPYGSDPS